ncbi:stretch-activated cation channel mid1, partial [Ascosphaera atra]
DLIVYSQDILNWQRWSPHFLGGQLSRRAPSGVEALKNNAPNKKNLRIGETQHFVVHKSVLTSSKSPHPKGFPKSDYDDGISIRSLAKRAKVEASGKQNVQKKSKTALYITATTCLQPHLNNSHAADDDAGPDQLTLYYSTTTSRPGPTTKDTEKAYFKEGYVNVTLYPDDDVYIGVGAANKSTSSSGSEGSEWTGIYNFEIAVSIDSNFHDVETDYSFLHFVDSDNSTALLWTDDATNAYPDDKVYKEWMEIDPPPFTLFAQDVKYASSIAGLRSSYCGLHNNVVINGDAYFKTKMTDKGLQQRPKEQFAVRGLNGSSTYLGFLAMKGNSTNSGDGVVGGGGKIWKAMNFTTKAGMC